MIWAPHVYTPAGWGGRPHRNAPGVHPVHPLLHELGSPSWVPCALPQGYVLVSCQAAHRRMKVDLPQPESAARPITTT